MNERQFTQSTINLVDRKYLTISGVDNVKDVSPNLINLFTMGQNMSISGENMQVIKLDVENGNLKIEGKIDDIKYNAKKEKFLKRLFK